MFHTFCMRLHAYRTGWMQDPGLWTTSLSSVEFVDKQISNHQEVGPLYIKIQQNIKYAVNK